MDEKEELTPPPSGGQHDNYINYDIAQIVVKESRKSSEGVGPEASLLDTESPLHAKPHPTWTVAEEEEAYPPPPTRPSISMSLDDEEEDYPEEVRHAHFSSS